MSDDTFMEGAEQCRQCGREMNPVNAQVGRQRDGSTVCGRCARDNHADVVMGRNTAGYRP